MADLILLNGPPASGKSTIAQRFVDERPLSLNLDIDVVRGLLGAWLDMPTNAGLAARSLALAMAEVHLLAGHDVIVPQFLGRVEFVEQLAALAGRIGCRFHEVALMIDRDDALVRFAERSANPSSASHHDAAALVERSLDVDPVGSMYDAFIRLIEQRPQTRRATVVRGDIDATFANFMAALAPTGL